MVTIMWTSGLRIALDYNVFLRCFKGGVFVLVIASFFFFFLLKVPLLCNLLLV